MLLGISTLAGAAVVAFVIFLIIGIVGILLTVKGFKNKGSMVAYVIGMIMSIVGIIGTLISGILSIGFIKTIFDLFNGNIMW